MQFRSLASVPICLTVSLAVVGSLPAATAARDEDAARRLAARATGATPMLDDLKELCDRIGGRPTGGPACGRAIEWAEAKLRAAGCDSVLREGFEVPILWLPGKEEASCLAPETFNFRVAAAPYTPSTPDGRALEARLVDARDGSADAFSRLGKAARGAVALVRRRQADSMADVEYDFFRNAAMLKSAAKARVAAVLLQSSRPAGRLNRQLMSVDGTLAPLPVGLVPREQADRLASVCAGGEARVSLRLDNTTSGPYESSNVIGEIRGRERPDEIVLIGGHLDSWDLGTGAEDNGVTDAMVIDLARGIKALGLRPRRTVRFALFTGEEQGLWGSAGYVQRHASELPNHVAAIIYDAGSGRTNGFCTNGRPELRQPVDRALSAVPGIGADDHSNEAFEGTDNLAFLLAGVPNLVANQNTRSYLPLYHSDADVFEHVNGPSAKKNEAIAAVLLWGLAEAPERAARQQTPAQVARVLRVTGLESQMKALGLKHGWPPSPGRRR